MGTIRVVFRTLEECQKYFNIAQNFDYNIDLQCGSKIIDGKSVLGIMSFGLRKELFMSFQTDDSEAIEEFLEQIDFCVQKENVCIAM